MRIRTYLAVSVLLLTGFTASAQRRHVNNIGVQPEIQTEWALQGNDYILASLSGFHYGQSGTLLSGGQLRVGYEHFWSERWSGGVALRLLPRYNQGTGELLGQTGNVIPGAFLRHSGKIGSVNFGQRLGVDYGISTPAGSPSRGLARLRLDLNRQFPVGEKVVLRPRIAYETAAYLRFQRDENELKERVLDLGNLRADLGICVSPSVDFTPWVAWSTVYANYVPQYDSLTGEQTSGGRTNVVTPVVGLDVRFTIFKGGTAVERQPLPSQH